MKYIELINKLIRESTSKAQNPMLYGQNINAGSCIGGLTKGLEVNSNGRIWNSTNAENSLVGLGFGLLMNGAQAAFFMKQMDFLLLGIDQLVNTYNIIRSIQHQNPNGSFTIVATVVDSGYEGPQSSLNNFADFCSMARIPGYIITNKVDAEHLIPTHLMQPGFRIIGVSQRLGKTEIIDPGDSVQILNGGSIFQYSSGKDLTVVSFNFSFPQAFEFCENSKTHGLKISHFNINSASATDWSPIANSVRESGQILILDDSKSLHLAADNLLAELCANVEIRKQIVLKREIREDWLHPRHDNFLIPAEIVNFFK